MAANFEKDKYERHISRLLRGIGARGTLKGFHYVIEIICTILETGEYKYVITKELYPYIAKNFGVSSPSVEQNIRTLIRDCWAYPDHKRLDELAGRHLLDKPSNSEFIEMVVDYIRYSELSD